MEYSAKDIYDKTRNALYKYEENAKKYRDKLLSEHEVMEKILEASGLGYFRIIFPKEKISKEMIEILKMSDYRVKKEKWYTPWRSNDYIIIDWSESGEQDPF